MKKAIQISVLSVLVATALVGCESMHKTNTKEADAYAKKVQHSYAASSTSDKSTAKLYPPKQGSSGVIHGPAFQGSSG